MYVPMNYPDFLNQIASKGFDLSDLQCENVKCLLSIGGGTRYLRLINKPISFDCILKKKQRTKTPPP